MMCKMINKFKFRIKHKYKMLAQAQIIKISRKIQTMLYNHIKLD